MKKIHSLALAIILLFCFILCSCESDNLNTQSDKLENPSNETQIQSNINSQIQSHNEQNQVDINNDNHVDKAESKSHIHNYTPVKTNATCKNQGYTTYICSCGHTYNDEFINGTHQFENNKCIYCGKANIEELFNFLKKWVADNGTVYGDYVYYSKDAENYGGYSGESFSLYYWPDNNKVEFCLHSVLDEECSINFYIYIPEKYSGNYEYISSYYYRDTGKSIYESKGHIDAKSFTKKQPLNSKEYIGSPTKQNDFMEMSRKGICDALDCLKQFLQVEKMGYTLLDLGFENY
ncbi:MAG: hypothetical protein IJO86_04255 [Oscillospiraceae bacterium]|nr:hypothetical protein [Oscillospiraceae bacterium]